MREPVSARTASVHVPLRSIAEACAFVDDLEPESIGELVVSGSGEPEGAVFVERGRVCWAAARGLSRRLSELLIARSALSAVDLEDFFWACRARGERFGEALVSRGIVTGDQLRTALLQHSTESLSLLCRTGMSGSWKPRSVGGYSPQFTFGTAEVLCRAGRTAHEDLATSAAREIVACFAEGEWAAAFVRTPEHASPQPIALPRGAPLSASRLVEAGRWAASALDLAHALQDEDAVVCVDFAARSLVAFRHEGAIVVGESGPHGPARLLNRRAEARRRRG